MRTALSMLLALVLCQLGALASTCYGLDPCNACHTCGYCKHCAVLGGSCGVCKGGRVKFVLNGKVIEISANNPSKQQRVCLLDQ
jgi:hypothetical protein